MPLLSLPEIEDEITQILELTTKHEELARAAQVNTTKLTSLITFFKRERERQVERDAGGA